MRATPLCLIALFAALASQSSSSATTAESNCGPDDGGIKVPPGFCVSVFADAIGHARHLVVSTDGVVYVNTWSGEYYGNDTPHSGGFLVALKDTKGTGTADVVARFGETVETGGRGGTGIGLYKDWLYAESNDRIVRYRLKHGVAAPRGAPETVVDKLPLGGDHPMHPFLIDDAGHLYVDLASATNSCQPQNRSLESSGNNPCKELETRGGVWLYDANRLNQTFSPSDRYATGLRNAEGFAIGEKGRLFVTQHGRDQLHSNFPSLYPLEKEATLPAEVVVDLRKGSDYGWPECYYDPEQRQMVLAPEYGGDAHKSGLCANKSGPAFVFPAHWGPTGMAYYSQSQFPENYRKGLYIAFHGSWNRAPFAQSGYLIAFQAPGRCEVFADGFAGRERSPDKAEHRPTGIAVGPDGSMYVSDDVRGRIYRITWRGGARGPAKTVLCPDPAAPPGPILTTADDKGGTPNTNPPPASSTLPVADGATREMVEAGDKLFHGQIAGAGCTGCHGSNATGSSLGPDLTRNRWFWSDGTWAGIAATIRTGVPTPRNFRSSMPAFGGANLSAEQVNSIASYIWGLSNAHANSTGTTSNLPADIHIPGTRVFPESIASSADGRLFIGSIAKRAIYVVDPGTDTAKVWIEAAELSNLGVYGVFADESSRTLWSCWSEGPGLTGQKQRSTLIGYDLTTGMRKAQYPLPTRNAFCNDITTTYDGSVYVTDSNNMEVDWMRRGTTSLKRWLGGGAFGPKDGVLDGISVVDGSLYVNTLQSNKLYVVPINGDGGAGQAREVQLDRPILQPDGMRSFGAKSLLITESGEPGRLSLIKLSGSNGNVSTIREGFPGGPTSVAVIGNTGYVLEGQLSALFDEAQRDKPLKPFEAHSVIVASPP